MTNWQIKKLGDIAQITKGKGLSKDDIVDDGKYRCVHYGELFTKYNEVIKEVRSRTNLSDGIVLSAANDVLMPTSDVTPRGLATASSLPFSDVVIGGDVLIIRPDEDMLDGRFFAYFVAGDRHAILRLTTGSTIFHLYGSDMKKLKIKLSEKPEQERIVGVLEVWDEYIEKLEQKIALKEQLKKGLMQELFNGKRRVNSSDSKWEYTTLSNFASKSKNAIVDGPFGSQMKLSEFTSTGVPVIEMHHLKNTFIEKLSLTRFVSEDKFKRDLSRSGVCGGDIIISKTGSLGYLGLMPGGESAVITSRLAKITIDQQMADRQFVFQYLKYMKMIGYWERIGQGGTMKILSIDNFKKMPIPNISKKEQEKLASILDLADKEIKALDDKRSRLVDQKKYILKNLITGTIRTPETLKPKGEAA